MKRASVRRGTILSNVLPQLLGGSGNTKPSVTFNPRDVSVPSPPEGEPSHPVEVTPLDLAKMFGRKPSELSLDSYSGNDDATDHDDTHETGHDDATNDVTRAWGSASQSKGSVSPASPTVNTSAVTLFESEESLNKETQPAALSPHTRKSPGSKSSSTLRSPARRLTSAFQRSPLGRRFTAFYPHERREQRQSGDLDTSSAALYGTSTNNRASLTLEDRISGKGIFEFRDLPSTGPSSPIYSSRGQSGQRHVHRHAQPHAQQPPPLQQPAPPPPHHQPIFHPYASKPLGLEQYQGVFAFDQLLQTFLFVTTEGHVRAVTPDAEVLLPNNINRVSIFFLSIVPGTGRFLTYGTRPLQKDEQSRWAGLPLSTVNLLQVWDLSQCHASSAKTLSEFAPVSFDLPYGILCISRVRHHKTMHPDTLFRDAIQFAKRSGRKRPVETEEEETVDAHEDKTKEFASLSSRQRLIATSQYIIHPDNSPFPFGKPSEDSRWIFLLGTSEGDVRFFDSWSLTFLDYFVTSEYVGQQLARSSVAHESLSKFFCVQQLSTLPAVKHVSFHPTNPSFVLIGYENGIIVLWSLAEHKLLRSYFPVPTQVFHSQDDDSTIPTIMIPEYLLKLQSILYLHCLQWYPNGTAFCAAVTVHCPTETPTRTTTENRLPSTCIAVMVFEIGAVLPSVVVSLDHLLQEPLFGWDVPMMHWEQARSRTGNRSTIASMMQGHLYLHLGPSSATTADALYLALQTVQRSRRVTARHIGSAGGATPMLPVETTRKPLANVYRLGGAMWSSVTPVFPCGASKSGSCFAFSSVQVVYPSPHQVPPGSYPVFGTLSGLRIPPGLEKDSGEDADTVIEAANKLTRYLAAATMLLVLVDHPIREVWGCCLKIDKERYKILSYLLPHMIPPLVTHGSTTPSASALSSGTGHREAPSLNGGRMKETDTDADNGEDDDDDDFAPWDSMETPLVFQVDWQSLSLADTTSLLWYPKDPSSLGFSGATSNSESLDACVDAWFTVRKKRTVHAWLQGLLGERRRMFVSAIARDPHRPPSPQRSLSSMTQDTSSPTARAGLSSSGSEGSLSDTGEDDWRRLNETPFFGDLLRVARCSWGSSSSSYPYQGVCVTGHSNGKLRLWAVTTGGMILLHTLTVVSSTSLFPRGVITRLSLENMEASRDTPDRVDLQVISETDAKPLVPHLPRLPHVTAVALHVPLVDVKSSSIGGTQTDAPRYIAAGCASGEVTIFQWYSTARSLPPMEVSVLLNHSPDAAEDLEEDSHYANGWPSVVPYGFNCISQLTQHTSRITALRFVRPSSGSTATTTVPRRQKSQQAARSVASKGLSWFSGAGGGGDSGSPLSPPSVVQRDPNETPEAKEKLRLISGDALGTVCLADLPSGRPLHILPSPPVSLPLAGEAAHRTLQGRHSETFSSGVVVIRPLSQPLLSLTTKIAFTAYPDTSSHEARVSEHRYVAIAYTTGLIRILDCWAGNFLDSTAPDTQRFITRLSQLGISTPPPGSEGSFQTENPLRPLLLEEVPVSYLDDVTSPAHDRQHRSHFVYWTSDIEKIRMSRPVFLALVTTTWAGVIEYRTTVDPTTTTALMPRQMCGQTFNEELYAASVTQIQDRHVVVVVTKSGKFKGFYPVVTRGLDLTIEPVVSSDPMATIPVGSIGSFGTDGMLLTLRRHADIGTVQFLLATPIKMLRDSFLRYEQYAWQQFELLCQQYIQYASLNTATTPSTNKTTGDPFLKTPEKKAKKGWKSSLLGKLYSSWSNDTKKRSVNQGLGTLRQFVHSAPRDCLPSARDGRFYNRDVSHYCISQPVALLSRKQYSSQQLLPLDPFALDGNASESSCDQSSPHLCDDAQHGTDPKCRNSDCSGPSTSAFKSSRSSTSTRLSANRLSEATATASDTVLQSRHPSKYKDSKVP